MKKYVYFFLAIYAKIKLHFYVCLYSVPICLLFLNVLELLMSGKPIDVGDLSEKEIIRAERNSGVISNRVREIQVPFRRPYIHLSLKPSY